MSEETSNCCWMPRMVFLRQQTNLVDPIFILDEDSETILSDGNVVERTVERTDDDSHLSPVNTQENAQEKVTEVEPNDSSSCYCCAICHDMHQSMATIDCCSHHSFCFSCIKEWSDRENTCPLCKTRFTTIHHFDESNEPVTTKVEDKNQQQADGVAPAARFASYEIGYGESVTVVPYGRGGPAFRISISSDGEPTLLFLNMPEGISSATTGSTGSE